ncbi:hypothetical protein [Smaragdicoccus niigatensis]|uniref:hypothetical protein n=1 Tax=Smaragdicoccus niigatensis TaxID=359359 RepID=UPI00036BDB18|nr:hypothetical protein [Smaragdicoccus niigatensis]
MTDPRALLFAEIVSQQVTAAIIAHESGIVAGVDAATDAAAALGLTIVDSTTDGKPVSPGDEVIRISGTPLQIAQAEEQLIGLLGKPSGIATAARVFVDRAAGGPRIVSGAWKKLPLSQKDMIRAAITVGGASPRIAKWPFAYLDKNIVTMLGGVQATMDAVDAQPGLNGFRTTIQVTNGEDAVIAARAGADIVFVDTGRIDDVRAADSQLRESGFRESVELAFGGGVRLEDIDELRALKVDIVDIGRAIVDARLLDMSLKVVDVK